MNTNNKKIKIGLFILIFFILLTSLFVSKTVFAEDMCPNIPGEQPVIPQGYQLNSNGDCIQTNVDTDWCPNLPGQQSGVPQGYQVDESGNCIQTNVDTDWCPNLPGQQNEVPQGYQVDESGNCIFSNTDTDWCPNVPGHQATLPAGMTTDESGNCVLAPVNCTPPVPGCANFVGPTEDATLGNTQTETNTNYELLAPLPGIDAFFESDPAKNKCALGKYLNKLIILIIGIAAVLAMVMIVMGGITYMTSELVSSKEAGKQQITHAILGLLLALGAWLILNTINPNLLKLCLDNLPPATVTIGPDAGDDTVDPDWGTGGGTYSTGAGISEGTTNALKKLQAGWEINRLVVSGTQMKIELKKGNDYDNSNSIEINHGSNGYAAVGAGRQSDERTPKGNWNIIAIRYTPGKPQFSQNGSNMGAAFLHLNPSKTGERGIGMHGQKDGTVSTETNGCVRVKNADLLALMPHLKSGIPVIIK
ncbi:MAG: L,D-transpeptidase [Candidatus Pacebacteria bacterium]|nr:L,D-transpeptidase [Candidatus Paceibacterota bacterium]